MLTNYLIFYGNLLWYDFNTDSEKLNIPSNTDSEKLNISREQSVATFTQLKPIPFLLRKYFRSLRSDKLKLFKI